MRTYDLPDVLRNNDRLFRYTSIPISYAFLLSAALTWYSLPASGILVFLFVVSGGLAIILSIIAAKSRLFFRSVVYISPLLFALLAAQTGLTTKIQAAGFRMARFPLSSFYSRCHMIEFTDNSIVFRLGACGNLKRDLDMGQVSFLLDTSGQIAKPVEERTAAWKAACRQIALDYVQNDALNQVGIKITGPIYALSL